MWQEKKVVPPDKMMHCPRSYEVFRKISLYCYLYQPREFLRYILLVFNNLALTFGNLYCSELFCCLFGEKLDWITEISFWSTQSFVSFCLILSKFIEKISTVSLKMLLLLVMHFLDLQGTWCSNNVKYKITVNKISFFT